MSLFIVLNEFVDYAYSISAVCYILCTILLKIRRNIKTRDSSR